MKPDQAAIDKAIAEDTAIQSIDQAIEKHKASEDVRVAEVRVHVDQLWAQAGELLRQAHNLRQKAQKLSRRLNKRRGPLALLRLKRNKRLKWIKAMLEEQFIKEQRLAFRRAHKLS